MANTTIYNLPALNTVDSTSLFPLSSNVTATPTTYQASIGNIGNAITGNLRLSGDTLSSTNEIVTIYGNVTDQATALTLTNSGDAALWANANVTINSNSQGSNPQWIFDTTGNLVLPEGGSIYSEGFTPSGNPGNTIILQPAGSGVTTDQRLLIYPTAGDGDHIHLTSGNLYQTELFLGNDNFFVKLANTGNIIINSDDNAGNTAQWKFSTDGNLTASGNLVIAGNTSVFGTTAALIQPTDDLPLLSLSSGANAGVSSIWVEDYANVGASNIAAVYANPTPESKIVRIAVGQNGGGGPNLWDFNANGTLTTPGNINLGNAALQSFGANYVLTANSQNYDTAVSMTDGGGIAITSVNTGVQITSGSNVWLFNTDGNLTLPGNTFAVNYANGTQVSLGGGNVTWAQLDDKNGNSGPTLIALGQNAGFDGQGNAAIAIGQNAGAGGQGASSITIGEDAGGNTTQGANAVAIGKSAGFDAQSIGAVAIGSGAGSNIQGYQSVAIGENAGADTQGGSAVALGGSAGENSQGVYSVAIGYAAAQINQGASAVAIGLYAGQTNQGNNSIVLNATGAALNQTVANTFTVAPVRNDTSNIAEVMFYNATSKEVTYGNSISVAGNITGAYFIGNGSQLTDVGVASVPSQNILPTIQSITISATSSGGTGGGSGWANVTVANTIPVTEYGVIVTNGTISQKYVTGSLGSIPGTVQLNITTGLNTTPFTVYAYITSNAGTYYSNSATGTSGICLLAGTQIALSDGSYKAIEDINYTDKMLSWDFDRGCYAETSALWIKRGETGSQYNLLTFSDGTTLRTFDQHRIFNKQAGAFTYPMTAATPIGTITVNEHGQEITLINKQVIQDTIEYYNVITDYHMNLFSDSVLTSCRFNNIYPITDMKFVKDARMLRTRDEFENVEDRFFHGLRLAEQTTDIETVEWYVNRLLSTELLTQSELTF